MKSRIHVIDLDGTLIDYDSFRTYTLLFLRNRQTFYRIGLYVLLRKFRLFSAPAFKAMIITAARRVRNYEEMMVEFADKILRSADATVLQIISEKCQDVGIFVLCSASPEDYVKHIAARLKWEYAASYFTENDSSFIHLFGQNKINEILRTYPPEQYEYAFAIADSASDHALLQKFRHRILITR